MFVKFTLIMTILLMLPVCIYGQEFRWATDDWNTTQGKYIKYDKIEHFIGGLVLTLGCKYIFGMSDVQAWTASVLFWALWEVKDAYIPWESFGEWGGDGASFRDFSSSAMGATFGLTIVVNL